MEGIYSNECITKDYSDRNKKFDSIIASDLSMLRLYTSFYKGLYEADTKIKPRVNNKFYVHCCFHSSDDTSLCIDEKLKSYYCYACHKGGTIVEFTSFVLRVSMEESIDMLYAYSNNDLDSLTPEQKEKIKKLFRYYNDSSIDKAYEISKRKTEILNERISSYLERYEDTQQTRNKLVKRLCCSHKHIPKKEIREDTLPF